MIYRKIINKRNIERKISIKSTNINKYYLAFFFDQIINYKSSCILYHIF